MSSVMRVIGMTGFYADGQITMLRPDGGQKRKIAKRITDAMVEEAGAHREGIIIAFHEVSKESYASGGELMVDKRAASVVSRSSSNSRATMHSLGTDRSPRL